MGISKITAFRGISCLPGGILVDFNLHEFSPTGGFDAPPMQSGVGLRRPPSIVSVREHPASRYRRLAGVRSPFLESTNPSG